MSTAATEGSERWKTGLQDPEAREPSAASAAPLHLVTFAQPTLEIPNISGRNRASTLEPTSTGTLYSLSLELERPVSADRILRTPSTTAQVSATTLLPIQCVLSVPQLGLELPHCALPSSIESAAVCAGLPTQSQAASLSALIAEELSSSSSGTFPALIIPRLGVDRTRPTNSDPSTSQATSPHHITPERLSTLGNESKCCYSRCVTYICNREDHYCAGPHVHPPGALPHEEHPPPFQRKDESPPRPVIVSQVVPHLQQGSALGDITRGSTTRVSTESPLRSVTSHGSREEAHSGLTSTVYPPPITPSPPTMEETSDTKLGVEALLSPKLGLPSDAVDGKSSPGSNLQPISTSIIRYPSKYQSQIDGSASEANSLAQPLPQDFMESTWFVTHSSLKLWRNKRNVNITYGPIVNDMPTARNPCRTLDVVRYQSIGKASVSEVRGVDTPHTPGEDGQERDGMWNWRGSGFLKPITSHWEVIGWGTDDSDEGHPTDWAVTWFQKTLFSAEGLDIYCRRREGVSTEMYDKIITGLRNIKGLEELVGMIVEIPQPADKKMDAALGKDDDRTKWLSDDDSSDARPDRQGEVPLVAIPEEVGTASARTLSRDGHPSGSGLATEEVQTGLHQDQNAPAS